MKSFEQKHTLDKDLHSCTQFVTCFKSDNNKISTSSIIRILRKNRQMRSIHKSYIFAACIHANNL